MGRLDRRTFVLGSAAVAGATACSPLLDALAGVAGASGTPRRPGRGGRVRGGYGPLRRVADQNGDHVLALPDGFEYVTFSRIGETMSDGTPVPRALDGMAAFGRRRTVVLVRNHELRTAPGTTAGGVHAPVAAKYDPVGVGGTTTLVFDTGRGVLDAHFVSSAGSIVNCAGGVADRGTGWITCEETVAGPSQGWGRRHGYTFLVPSTPRPPERREPLTALGRFVHEAVAVDPRTGTVYETEDDGDDSGLYRFRPVDRGDLLRGGRLEMLAIRDQPQRPMMTGQEVGRALPVTWVPIADPDPDLEGGATPVPQQGIALGAALFNRLEGIRFDPSSGGFLLTSTSGGEARLGQVWHYHPRREQLTLFFESPGGSVLDSPDNLAVSPRGGILLCEDDASGTDGDTHPLAPGIRDVNRLVGLTPRGEVFELAVNTLNDTELAGVTFSPDGRVLFVNVFGDGTPGSGMTCAVTGPWRRGCL